MKKESITLQRQGGKRINPEKLEGALEKLERTALSFKQETIKRIVGIKRQGRRPDITNRQAPALLLNG
jgi:hypothetical protein